MISKDLGYIKSDDFQELQQDIGDVERMLKALIKSLQSKNSNPPALRDLPFYSPTFGFLMRGCHRAAGTPSSAKIILRCGAAFHKI
jgi:hypothetical protein